ncbi:MAG: hypothetical protein ACK5MO_11370 [Planctomyces sp.]
MHRFIIATAASIVLTFGIDTDAEAQLFGRRSQPSRPAASRSDNSSSLPQHLQRIYNPNTVRLNRLQERRIERTAEKDQQEAAKKGISVQDVVDRRMQRAQTFAAIARGLSGGLSAASAAAYSYQATAPATPARSTGSGETRNQWLWKQYNRNYTNESKYYYLNQMR